MLGGEYVSQQQVYEWYIGMTGENKLIDLVLLQLWPEFD